MTVTSTNPFKRSNEAKRQKQSEEEQTLKNWYGMAKKEMSKELENELTIMKLKRYLHKTSFVKTADSRKLPKYFEVSEKN